MKISTVTTVLLASALSSGCIATYVTKEVSVTKDANGKVVQTVETEKAEQRQSFMPFSLKYLNLK